MFQNISKEIEEEDFTEEKNNKAKLIMKNMFKLQNVFLYIITLAISTISIINGISPFGIAMFAAACSSGAVAFPVFISAMIGTFIGTGIQGTIIYIFNSIVFIALMMLVRPKWEYEEQNEMRKLGMHLMSAIFLVQATQIFSASFMVSDVLETILKCLITYIFYKIFVNSIPVIEKLGTKVAFSAEEAIGTSIVIAIAICSLGDLNLFGFSIRNILCILLVLIWGWNNGGLIGTTTGVTLAVMLSLIGMGDTSLIAVYAIAGLIAGVVGRINKIGLAVVIVIEVASIYLLGDHEYINHIKEALIASLCLIVMPRKISINIEDIIGKSKFLPVTRENKLEENKDTIFKLNTMSESVDEIAKSYEEAAATIIDKNDTNNLEIFKEDLLNNLEAIQNNILYDDLVDTNNGIIDDIFNVLIEKEKIESSDLIEIFEKHNSYIFGTDDKEMMHRMEKQIYQVVKNINYTYEVSKINFIWRRKVSTNNKIVSEQFSTVSKVINDMAKQMENEKKEESKRGQEVEKFKFNIGISKTTKNKSKVSGDSSTQIKLKDGKYLFAISDGMGSGERAKKSSKMAINMLENLLVSGFQKEESINLINSALNTNMEDETFATIDVSILDLYDGNIEFVKLGSSPTYIKTGEKIIEIKESTMPVGMTSKIDVITYDRDIEDGDLIVMCSDGIIESAGEKNEKWLENLLKKFNTDNVQKIADIIIQEAIDNGMGIAKDDMTVLVVKILKNQ